MNIHGDEKTYLGPLPAVPGCRCQICLPEASYDHEDRATIERVLRHGWSVMLVGAGDDDCSCGCSHESSDEPAFAYTIGLTHRVDHPELVMSGLRGDLMHSALNNVAERVMAGRVLKPGDLLEGVFGLVPVLVEAMTPAGLGDTALWSKWFHRKPVRAMQLVWPDTSGRFAWQPGAAPAVATGQPSHWRHPVPKVGAYAVDPQWRFPVPAEKHVSVCTHFNLGAVINYVAHRHDQKGGDEWLFECGEEHVGPESHVPSHVSHVVRGMPSVTQLADLAVGESARREGPDHPWKRSSGGN